MNDSFGTTHSTRRCAFTLIELLVSIGIVAVLLAIALPALRSARSNSVTLQCLTNLASLGSAYEMYAVDHRGALPILDYPLDPLGVADPIVVDGWSGAESWLLLPVDEITFWGYQLRNYIVDDPDEQVFSAIERLSCPVVFNRWLDNLPQDELSGVIEDPMYSPVRSYNHSVALYTSAAPWRNHDATPDLNAIHAVVPPGGRGPPVLESQPGRVGGASRSAAN